MSYLGQANWSREEAIKKVRGSVAAIAQLEEPYKGQVIQSYSAALLKSMLSGGAKS